MYRKDVWNSPFDALRSSGAGPSGARLVRRLEGVHDVWDYSLGNPTQAIRWGTEGRMQRGGSVRDGSQDS